MKHILLALMLVVASFISVLAQTREQEDTLTSVTRQQAAATVELDRAELAFKGSKFSTAQDHAEKALIFDPTNKTALMIIARSMHARYRNDDQSPENLVRAREAIAAYQRVSSDPDDDEAYKAIKELYGAINENNLQYVWIMQRAISFGLPAVKRVEAYIDLAVLDLKSSLKTAEGISEKLYSEVTGVIENEQLDIATRNAIASGQEDVSRGRQMVRQAIALDPENESAWTLEVQLLRSSASLFVLEGNKSKAEQCQAEADEVLTRASDVKISQEEAARERMVMVDCGELCERVISTPKPPYPPIARAARAYGPVTVQVAISEEGNVTSASAISGHPLLRAAAVQAARVSTFSRTYVLGQPVKVVRTLTYNFTLP